MPSDIQVFVRFKEPYVFAGEEVVCTITFKNAAPAIESPLDNPRSWLSRGWSATGARNLKPGADSPSTTQNPRSAAISVHGARKTSVSYRSQPSIAIPGSQSTGPRAAPWAASPVAQHKAVSGSHQRSISIISIGSPNLDNEEIKRNARPRRGGPVSSHSRSTSIQVNQKTPGELLDVESTSLIRFDAQDPLGHSDILAQGAEIEGNRTGAHFGNLSNSAANSNTSSHRLSPTTQGESREVHGKGQPRRSGIRSSSPARSTEVTDFAEANNTKGVHLPDNPESARTSVDLYSLSNHSQETLASEQPPIVLDRRPFSSSTLRQPFKIDPASKPRGRVESLLMGYGQVTAGFILDGALVDQSPFEEVKRKGFLGGQGGGGVVGVKPSVSSGGILSGFSLNSIGGSLGGLLGGQDFSSLKEMKDVASSRTIPLLSTPQSLLFVDLTLTPGEEKSFFFSFSLPQGLPASYKGKAIKINYNLNIGVQGAPGEKSIKTIRRISIPFRVFSGVSADGEVLGHDLMQPHVMLQDIAQSEPVLTPSFQLESIPKKAGDPTEAGAQEFLQYVDLLLNKRQRRQSSSTIFAPPKPLEIEGDGRARAAIDYAIMLSKQNPSTQQSRNRFEIVRNGLLVAMIILDRVLLRLGETLTASIDFSKGDKPCHSLRCTLETTEQVNPALALRSAASITRLSRRVHYSQFENTLFAQRVVFTPSIPVVATPTFSTSGVNLHWALRFEFTTSRDRKVGTEDEGEEEDDKPVEGEDNLLEAVTNDDRGSILAAVESLQCESFEASIPITVYGDKMVAEIEPDEMPGVPI